MIFECIPVKKQTRFGTCLCACLHNIYYSCGRLGPASTPPPPHQHLPITQPPHQPTCYVSVMFGTFLNTYIPSNCQHCFKLTTESHELDQNTWYIIGPHGVVCTGVRSDGEPLSVRSVMIMTHSRQLGVFVYPYIGCVPVGRSGTRLNMTMLQNIMLPHICTMCTFIKSCNKCLQYISMNIFFVCTLIGPLP